MSRVTVLYHAGCPDGFGAAWAFYQKYGAKAKYVPVRHSDEPPVVTGRDVFIVDFCYPRAILEELEEEANTLTVIDHHKTSQESCGDLEYCHFDMSQSGAVLAWKFLFKRKPVPPLLRYIQDRDLWTWELDKAEEVLSVVDSHKKSFSEWNRLSLELGEPCSPAWSKVVSAGGDILRYKETLVKMMLSNVHRLNIAGENVPAVNSSSFQSEIGNILCEDEEFAAVYYFDGEKFRFSLRSKENRMDVSTIALEFGGGGHKNAAGFFVKNMNELETEGDRCCEQ